MTEPQALAPDQLPAPTVHELYGYAQGLQSRIAVLEEKIAAYERQLAEAAATPVVRGALAALGIKLPDRL